MGLLSRFQAINEADKTKAVQRLIEEETPDFDFFFMAVLSVLMASFGLLAGSETVVIGSMLLAPVMSPILGLALGLAMSSHQLMRRSITTILKVGLWGIGAAVVATVLFSFGDYGEGMNIAISARTEPSLLFLVVAILAGFSVTYTTVKPKLSATLPGVAVAVALVPPLAVIGIGIARLDMTMAAGASVMLLVNVAGIVFASMLMLSVMDVHHKRFIASKVIKKEDDRVEKEEKKIEEIEEVAKNKQVEQGTA